MAGMECTHPETQIAHVGRCTLLTGDTINQLYAQLAKMNGRPVLVTLQSEGRVAATKNPARLIVHFGGNTSEKYRRVSATKIHCEITRALSTNLDTKDVVLLGVHRNKNGKIILSFPDDTPDQTLHSLIPTIRAALELTDSSKVTLDVPWSSIMVSFVRTRQTPGSAISSEVDLIKSLLLNPVIKDLTITRHPSWVKTRNWATAAHASFVFSFEDRDGFAAQSILSAQLFIFGDKVVTRPWVDNIKSISKPHTPTTGPQED